jgi:hypothetical protein
LSAFQDRASGGHDYQLACHSFAALLIHRAETATRLAFDGMQKIAGQRIASLDLRHINLGIALAGASAAAVFAERRRMTGRSAMLALTL